MQEILVSLFYIQPITNDLSSTSTPGKYFSDLC